MPKHVRGSIRDYFAQLLEDAAELDGVVIYKNRLRPIGIQENGKALEILVASESAQPIGSGKFPPQYERSIQVQIVGYNKAKSEDVAADESDELAALVEEIFGAVVVPAPLFTDLIYEATDFALDPGAYRNASFAQTWRIITSAEHPET